MTRVPFSSAYAGPVRKQNIKTVTNALTAFTSVSFLKKLPEESAAGPSLNLA